MKEHKNTNGYLAVGGNGSNRVIGPMDRDRAREVAESHPGLAGSELVGLVDLGELARSFGILVSKLKIKDALKVLQEEEAAKMINEEEIKLSAVENVEQNGIVFLDELDKVAKRGEYGGPDVSREGVQRDLLPLVEGCTVSTKFGMVRTDHILFIASGAFHLAKPSDLIPELQGRLPIRVELRALSVDDFVRILTEPDASLTEQYTALMQTEEVNLTFNPDGVRRIAEIAYQVNEQTENIGARRLHTVLERLLETVSFEAPDRSGDTITIDQQYVDDHLGELVQDQDLARYIL